MRFARFAIPALLVAAVAALVVSFAAAQARDPYEFKVDLAKDDITATAAEVHIEPRFRGITDDRFPLRNLLQCASARQFNPGRQAL